MAYTYPVLWSYNNPIFNSSPGLLYGDVSVVGVCAQFSDQTPLRYVYVDM